MVKQKSWYFSDCRNSSVSIGNVITGISAAEKSLTTTIQMAIVQFYSN